jgi:hypothetical protein
LYALETIVSAPPSRIYVGRLEGASAAVYAVDAASVERLHPPLEGFAWGPGAEDTSLELARVLLTDAAGSEPPADACRRFTEQILNRLPQDGFALQRDTVNAWLRRVVAGLTT